jgi:PERQ amino acid-rich with GYF domain-containing protein
MDNVDRAFIPPAPQAPLEDFILKKATNEKNRAQRETRAPNGTAVLRRPSTTPFSQAPTQRDPTLPTPGSETPGSNQQLSQNFDQSTNFRISKNQMLDIFRAQQDSGSIKRDVSHLFEGNWDPGHSNGTNGRSGWGKSTDGRESHGPDVCWDEDGSVLPVGLEEMSEQEQAVGRMCIFQK